MEDGPETATLSLGQGDTGMDVSAVRLEATGSHLELTVTTARPIRESLDARQSPNATPVHLGIDVDDDESTGEADGQWSILGKVGHEYELRVSLFQDTRRSDGVHYLASYYLVRLATPRGEEIGDMVDDERLARSRIEGQQAFVSVPYSELGLESGQTVRVMIQEAEASGNVDEVFLPDARVEIP